MNAAATEESSILIVDAAMLVTISASLTAGGDVRGFATIMGEDDWRAREILKAVPAALQVNSVRMAVGNGYELVTFAERNFGRLTIFALAVDGAADAAGQWSPRSSVRWLPQTCRAEEIGAEIMAELRHLLEHASPCAAPRQNTRSQTDHSNAPLKTSLCPERCGYPSAVGV